MLALKLQGAGGATRLMGAVVAASGVLLVASDGPHRLAWALVGGCCAGIAFAARTEPRVTPFTDPATLNWMLRRILLAVLAGFAGLALLAALSGAGAPRAIIALVLLSATGLCIVGLTATAMLLALPLRAIVAEAPRASPARFSGVQPLADLVAAGLASLAVLLASTRARGDDRPARAARGDGRSERTRPSDP